MQATKCRLHHPQEHARAAVNQWIRQTRGTSKGLFVNLGVSVEQFSLTLVTWVFYGGICD